MENTFKFTLTYYNGVGERPLVILVNHSYKGGQKFEDIESLKEAVGERQIYNVFDKYDSPIHGIDNWNTNKEVDWDKLRDL